MLDPKNTETGNDGKPVIIDGHERISFPQQLSAMRSPTCRSPQNLRAAERLQAGRVMATFASTSN